MKISSILLGILCFMQFNFHAAMAQQSIAGVYSQSSGNPEGGNTFFVFDDNRFVVAFFGGVIVGKWQMENDRVIFTPHVAENQFLVYGRKNKDLKDSCRVYFQGFDDQDTYIGFGGKQAGKPLLKSVFNPSPNCVGFPIVHQFNTVPSELLFSDQPYGNESTTRQVYRYANTEKYNDFVAYYLEESSDRRPFFATLKDGALYFRNSDKGSQKSPLPTSGENFKFIQQILNAPQSVNQVFYSPFYNQKNLDVNDTANWKFDDKKNAYINFLNYEEGEEYQSKADRDYNRVTILYQFKLLQLTDKKVLPFAIDSKPLFIRKCDEKN